MQTCAKQTVQDICILAQHLRVYAFFVVVVLFCFFLKQTHFFSVLAAVFDIQETAAAA